MSDTQQLREQICAVGRSLFDRGLVFGRTGNISVKTGDRIIATPSGLSLADLHPDTLSVLDLDGSPVEGPKPTKEAFLHAAMYQARPAAAAVVHTHSTYSAALSCRADLDAQDVLPPLTAYYCMRVGHVPLLPYHAPGDSSLLDVAFAAAQHHHCLLLAKHGPVVAGDSLDAAVDALEELEQTARLFFLLEGRPTSPLSPDQAARWNPAQ